MEYTGAGGLTIVRCGLFGQHLHSFFHCYTLLIGLQTTYLITIICHLLSYWLFPHSLYAIG